MATSGCDQVWSKAICDDIASAVMTTVNQIRCAQRVFHPTVLGNGQTSVPNHILGGPGPLTIQEGSTKPLIELSFEFALTHTQVDAEGSLHNGKTLALLAAKAVARAEDAILFMGEHANLPRGVQVANRDSAGAGLVGAAGATIEVSTNPADGYPGSILESVARGISDLVAQGQPGPYAFFLDSRIFADTHSPLRGTLVTTSHPITQLVQGAFCSVPRLEAAHAAGNTVPAGLLASLGGEPTTIYLGADTTTAYTQQDQGGNFRFRVFERIQFVARDEDALVRYLFM